LTEEGGLYTQLGELPLKLHDAIRKKKKARSPRQKCASTLILRGHLGKATFHGKGSLKVTVGPWGAGGGG